MLSELVIRNIAIIDELTLSFSQGLNVLSGETGAGKSIIVNAINLVQGTRTSADIIRGEEEEASVDALFDVSDNDPVFRRIDELGFEKEEHLLIKRTISHSGRNKVFINGGLATLGMLASIGEDLITVSGQHENQLLLNAERHIDILDDFGNLHPKREKMGILFTRLQNLSRELIEMIQSAEKRAEKQSLLDFQYNEIERANLQPGEDVALKDERNILVNSEKLLGCSHLAYDTIYGEKGSIIENLQVLKNDIKEISKIDSSLSPLCDAMESSIINLEDIAFSLRDYAQKIEYNPTRLEEVELRLIEIAKIKKKYGSTIDEILQYKDRIQNELRGISHSENNLAHLKAEIEDIEKEVLGLAKDLSTMRKAAAEKLKANVEKELWSIGMEKTRFQVDMKSPLMNGGKGNFYGNLEIGGFKVTGKGMDCVEFLLSPNPGEPLRPLSKIASGGELSRIILALKSILARLGGTEVLIFDEVDAGIGGRVADIVGQKLKSLSQFHQVICITHLPQIARFADTHFHISKAVKDGRTFTSVKRLEKDERVGEIARMLGGTEITDTVREYARELIEKAPIQ